MVDATTYWRPWEETVASIADFQELLEELFTKWVARGRTFAWRGVVDATWPLHSSLYRRLAKELGAGSGGVPWPEEPAVAAAEAKVMSEMRRWGLHRGSTGPLSTLEQLAVLQHFGAPTRLLDVTFDAYVALWFAVEDRPDGEGKDGRVFAVDVTARLINDNDALRFWENTHDTPWKDDVDWPTRTVAWRPAPVDRRIAAQKGGFLLAGVPAVTFQPRKTAAPADGRWQADEARAFTCLPLHVHELGPNPAGAPPGDGQPAYTLRIDAHAKAHIRSRLESLFGHSHKTLFPDLPGFAAFTRRIALR